MAIIKTLDAYSVHGHLRAGATDEQLLDYVTFFAQLASDGVGESVRVGADTVALVEVVGLGARTAFRFASGNASEVAEAYDPATGTTTAVLLDRERFIVNWVWVIVDPTARIVALERKRPGVPVFQLERFMNEFGRNNAYRRLTVSLHPVPSPSFTEEILSFTRIREASVTIQRPNHSFDAAAREAVAQIARDSNAGTATIQINAERKESLEKNSGIVADIIAFASNALSPIVNAVVKGVRPGFGKERTVSLHKHQLKATAEVSTTATPAEQLETLDATAATLISSASDSANSIEEFGALGSETADG
ncbi:DUF4747 family protein [Microbacterium sp. EST19A]|uniref:DUF4747 family protein n=1 Tax=Microbacterium sp. EST19A TaxID=2862681 RepID=UPI001CBA9C2F|nr:DUF4747 family protein [Microbacterium sp. EST19A]